MTSRRTRTLVWCLALVLLGASPSAAQSVGGPPPVSPGDRSGDVFLGDGGGSELPGPAVTSPKSGPPAGQLKPGLPGAPTLTPGGGGGGGGGGVVTPPDDGGDDGHGDPPDDDGGDGTTPGDDPPPDDGGDGHGDPPDDGGDGTSPGAGLGTDGPPSWRVQVTRRGPWLLLTFEGAAHGARFVLRWQVELPRLGER